MPTDNHDLRLDVDDGDNNNCQRRKKLAGNKRRSPPTSEHSGEMPVAVTPNRWFLQGGVLSPRPRTTRDDVDSGSVSDGDGDGDYRDRTGARWTDERPGSQPPFDDYVDRATTRRHKYGSWYERLPHADGDVRDDDVTAHLSLGCVAEQHGDDAAEHISIARHDDNGDDDDRQARDHRRTTSPADQRRRQRRQRVATRL